MNIVMSQTTLKDAIGRNISINVETIPQNPQNKALNESNSTPLHVRIKLHNKDDAISRKFHVSKTKAAQCVDKGLKQCSSEQTILSFNLLVEPHAQEPVKPRKRFFNRLLPNACMGVQISDDENPYLPSQTRRRESETTDRGSTESSDDRDHNTKKFKKKKFKPGGCLDPTFSEESFVYQPTLEVPKETKDYNAPKKQIFLTNADNGENKSIHSLYQATNAKSSGLITYPHHLKDNEDNVVSDRPRQSSTFSQSAQYYFGQNQNTADKAKQESSDPQKGSRELLNDSTTPPLPPTNNDKQYNKDDIENKKNKKTKIKPKRKYKPGGCLDPHFSDDDEDYSYLPGKKKNGKENEGISLISSIYKNEFSKSKVSEPKMETQLVSLAVVRSDEKIKVADEVQRDSVESMAKRQLVDKRRGESMESIEKIKLGDSKRSESVEGSQKKLDDKKSIETVEDISKKKNTDKELSESVESKTKRIHEKKGKSESLQDTIRRKLSGSPKRSETAAVAVSGLATGATIGGIVGIVKRISKEKGKNTEDNKFESGGERDFEYDDNINKPNEHGLASQAHDFGPINKLMATEVGQQQEKEPFTERMSRLSKDKISKHASSTKKSKDPNNEDGTKLFNNSSDVLMSMISRETSKNSILETKKSPERKIVTQTDDKLNKEMLRGDIGDIAQTSRDLSPKYLQESVTETGGHTRGKSNLFKDSQKPSPKKLSFEILEKKTERTKRSPERKSSKDANNVKESTDFNKDQNKPPYSVRSSDVQFAESQLRKWSPERRSSKDLFGSKETFSFQRDQSKKSSSLKFSDDIVPQNQLKKSSPDQTSKKDTHKVKEPPDSYNKIEPKSSIISLSPNNFAENQLKRVSPEPQRDKVANDLNDKPFLSKDQSPPAKHLPTSQFAESQHKQMFPESRSEKDTNNVRDDLDYYRDPTQQSVSLELKSNKDCNDEEENILDYKRSIRQSIPLHLSNNEFARSQFKNASPELTRDKDHHSLNNNLGLQKDLNQPKSSSGRLSYNQNKMPEDNHQRSSTPKLLDSTLRMRSPEQKSSKTTNIAQGSADIYSKSSRKASPPRFSELVDSAMKDKLYDMPPEYQRSTSPKLLDSTLKMRSPEQRSSKTTNIAQDSADIYIKSSRKASPPRFSDFVDSAVEDKLYNNPSEYQGEKSMYSSNEKAKKPSSSRSSNDYFEKLDESQSHKKSFERVDDEVIRKYASGKLSINTDKSDSILPATYSSRSGRQSLSDYLGKTVERFSNISIKRTPERKNSKQNYDIQNTDVLITDKDASKDSNYEQNAFLIKDKTGVSEDKLFHFDESQKKYPLNSADISKDSSTYLDSSTSNKNIRTDNNSDPDLTIRLSKNEVFNEEKASSLQLNHKQYMQTKPSDFSKKSTDNIGRSSASINSPKYRALAAISNDNYEDDLKDLAYKNIPENVHDEIDSDSPNYQDEYNIQNQAYIETGRPNIYTEYDGTSKTFELEDNDINFTEKLRSDTIFPTTHQSNTFTDLKSYLDQPFPTLYEDNESSQSKILSASDGVTLQSGDTYAPSTLVISIDVAQNTNNVPSETQGTPSYDTDYKRAHTLNNENDSKIFQPTNFKTMADSQTFYDFDDNENGFAPSEPRGMDWSLDQDYRTEDSKSPVNKTTSKSMQYTKSSSVISDDILLKNGPLYADMLFQTYKNNNNERILKTLDSDLRPDMTMQSTAEIHEVKQHFTKYTDKAIIPISKSSNILIQIQQDKRVLSKRSSKSSKAEKANSVSFFTQGDEDYQYASRKQSEKSFMSVLGALYERELLPLQHIIKTLKIEIDTLMREQIQLNRKMQRSTRLERLIPVNTTCRCQFK